jgi:hypothetical protein
MSPGLELALTLAGAVLLCIVLALPPVRAAFRQAQARRPRIVSAVALALFLAVTVREFIWGRWDRTGVSALALLFGVVVGILQPVPRDQRGAAWALVVGALLALATIFFGPTIAAAAAMALWGACIGSFLRGVIRPVAAQRPDDDPVDAGS